MATTAAALQIFESLRCWR